MNSHIILNTVVTASDWHKFSLIGLTLTNRTVEYQENSQLCGYGPEQFKFSDRLLLLCLGSSLKRCSF